MRQVRIMKLLLEYIQTTVQMAQGESLECECILLKVLMNTYINRGSPKNTYNY